MYSVCGPQASLWDRTVEFVQQTATRVRGWFETVRQKFRAQRTKGASCRNTCRDGKIFARCTNVVLWNCALFLAAFGKVGLGQGVVAVNLDPGNERVGFGGLVRPASWFVELYPCDNAGH